MTVDNFPNVDSVTKELIEGENFAEQRLPYIPLGEIIEKESKGQVKHYSIWPSFKEGGCKSIKEFEHRVCKICNLEGKKYIYAYWDEPDKTMHPEGTSSKRVKKHMIGKKKTDNLAQFPCF
mgnify:CR=1 FL=1